MLAAQNNNKKSRPLRGKPQSHVWGLSAEVWQRGSAD